jgi:hypothetical protein
MQQSKGDHLVYGGRGRREHQMGFLKPEDAIAASGPTSSFTVRNHSLSQGHSALGSELGSLVSCCMFPATLGQV